MAIGDATLRRTAVFLNIFDKPGIEDKRQYKTTLKENDLTACDAICLEKKNLRRPSKIFHYWGFQHKGAVATAILANH